MNYKKLETELIENIKRLRSGKQLQNKDLWLGNPWPIHEYFSLFNYKSNINDQDLKKLSKIKIDGVNIKLIKDSGWICNTIRVSLIVPFKKIIIKTYIKNKISNLWFKIKAAGIFIPIIKLILIYKRSIKPLFIYNANTQVDSLVRYYEKRIKRKNKNYKICVFSENDNSGKFLRHYRVRFDGAGFEEFRNDNDDEIKIPKNLIRKICNFEEIGIKLDRICRRSEVYCDDDEYNKYNFYKLCIYYKEKGPITKFTKGGIIAYFIITSYDYILSSYIQELIKYIKNML